MRGADNQDEDLQAVWPDLAHVPKRDRSTGEVGAAALSGGSTGDALVLIAMGLVTSAVGLGLYAHVGFGFAGAAASAFGLFCTATFLHVFVRRMQGVDLLDRRVTAIEDYVSKQKAAAGKAGAPANKGAASARSRQTSVVTRIQAAPAAAILGDAANAGAAPVAGQKTSAAPAAPGTATSNSTISPASAPTAPPAASGNPIEQAIRADASARRADQAADQGSVTAFPGTQSHAASQIPTASAAAPSAPDAAQAGSAEPGRAGANTNAGTHSIDPTAAQPMIQDVAAPTAQPHPAGGIGATATPGPMISPAAAAQSPEMAGDASAAKIDGLVRQLARDLGTRPALAGSAPQGDAVAQAVSATGAANTQASPAPADIEPVAREAQPVRSVMRPPADEGNAAPGAAAEQAAPTSSASVAAAPIETSAPVEHAVAPGSEQDTVIAGGDPALIATPVAANDPVATALGHAAQTNTVEIYLQPVLSLEDRKIRFFEVVGRVGGADNDVLAIEEHKDTARAHGLLPGLDRALLIRSARLLKALAARQQAQPLFCNLSADALADAGFMQTLFDDLAGCQDIAPYMIIEVPGDALVNASESTRGILMQIKRLGYRLSVDDVWDVEAVLAIAAPMDVSFMKLSVPAFLSGTDTAAAQARALAILAAAHDRGIRLIVDRIERKDELAAVARTGADLGQGYLFSEPKPLLPQVAAEVAVA